MNTEEKEMMSRYAVWVERALDEYFAEKQTDDATKTLFSAMKYSVSAGGKRIRPVLALEFCRCCGASAERALSAACAIEMVHTFSLIHDDLPAMDNDDMRRGKPSCHKAFGEAEAILAGDALAIAPFDIVAADASLSFEARVAVIAELAAASGASGMIGGQIIDIENEKRNDIIGTDELLMMYSRKTSALLSCACKTGCIAAGAPRDKIEAAGVFAEKLGLAFQIVDDILDIVGDESTLGKPVGSDKEQNKQTFASLCGAEKAGCEARRLTEEALSELDKFNDNGFLKSLTRELLYRKS